MPEEKFERYFGKPRDKAVIVEGPNAKMPGGRVDPADASVNNSMKASVNNVTESLAKSDQRGHYAKAADFTGMEEEEERQALLSIVDESSKGKMSVSRMSHNSDGK